MPGKDPDNDFILIDDLIDEGLGEDPPATPPPRPPVQMPLPQGAPPPKPSAKGQEPSSRTPRKPRQRPPASASLRAVATTGPTNPGRESKIAAVMGVSLILVAVGMVFYFAPSSPDVVMVAPEPIKFSVPAPPPAAPTADRQAPAKAPIDTAPVEMATDTGPPPIEAASELPEEAGIEPSVKDFLSVWRTAWENSAGVSGEMAPYLACYAPGFRHSGMDKETWAAEKADKNRRKDWIRVRISDILVNTPVDDGTWRVTFFQEYASSNYHEASLKTLLLKLSGNSWQIIAEQ